MNDRKIRKEDWGKEYIHFFLPSSFLTPAPRSRPRCTGTIAIMECVAPVSAFVAAQELSAVACVVGAVVSEVVGVLRLGVQAAVRDVRRTSDDSQGVTTPWRADRARETRGRMSYRAVAAETVARYGTTPAFSRARSDFGHSLARQRQPATLAERTPPRRRKSPCCAVHAGTNHARRRAGKLPAGPKHAIPRVREPPGERQSREPSLPRTAARRSSESRRPFAPRRRQRTSQGPATDGPARSNPGVGDPAARRSQLAHECPIGRIQKQLVDGLFGGQNAVECSARATPRIPRNRANRSRRPIPKPEKSGRPWAKSTVPGDGMGTRSPTRRLGTGLQRRDVIEAGNPQVVSHEVHDPARNAAFAAERLRPRGPACRREVRGRDKRGERRGYFRTPGTPPQGSEPFRASAGVHAAAGLLPGRQHPLDGGSVEITADHVRRAIRTRRYQTPRSEATRTQGQIQHKRCVRASVLPGGRVPTFQEVEEDERFLGCAANRSRRTTGQHPRRTARAGPDSGHIRRGTRGVSLAKQRSGQRRIVDDPKVAGGTGRSNFLRRDQARTV